MKYGIEALIAAGFPYEFAAIAMLKSFRLNVALALRVGQPPNISKGFAVATKSGQIKTKTCSDAQHIPMLSGFIAWQQEIFGQLNSAPIPENGFQPVQLRVSLAEILADADKGEYAKLQLCGNELQFITPKANNELKKQILFSINLADKQPALPIDDETSHKLNPWVNKVKINKPAFWDDARFGSFEAASNALYPVRFETQAGNRQALTVVATPDGKPVTGDIDVFWVAMPIRFAEAMNHKQYNVANPAELQALLDDYQLLCQQLQLNDSNEPVGHPEIFAKNAGVITPYELLLEKFINDDFDKQVTHFSKPFQHGPETNNPGKLSDTNQKLLHIINGLPVLTENENELINFIMQPGFLENYYIRVHPGWNMDKWSQVIDRQLQLHQHINEKTLANYHEHQSRTKQTYATDPARSSFTNLVKQKLTFFHHPAPGIAGHTAEQNTTSKNNKHYIEKINHFFHRKQQVCGKQLERQKISYHHRVALTA